MIEAHCDYKKTAKFDDILEVQTTVPEVYEKGFKVESKVYKVDNDDLTLIAEGYTIHLTADMNRKVSKVPQEFIDAFGGKK
jgi:acyl-CoA thioesterase FadM